MILIYHHLASNLIKSYYHIFTARTSQPQTKNTTLKMCKFVKVRACHTECRPHKCKRDPFETLYRCDGDGNSNVNCPDNTWTHHREIVNAPGIFPGKCKK